MGFIFSTTAEYSRSRDAARRIIVRFSQLEGPEAEAEVARAQDWIGILDHDEKLTVEGPDSPRAPRHRAERGLARGSALKAPNAEFDPKKFSGGETAQERRNRIKREKRAAARAGA